MDFAGCLVVADTLLFLTRSELSLMSCNEIGVSEYVAGLDTEGNQRESDKDTSWVLA